MIVRTEPEPFATLTNLDGRIRFHFDERISESVQSGTLRDAFTVSPMSGEVEVSHDSRSLEVRVEGGLRPGVVYRVTLLPVVRDLFGNQLRDPFELVFSTGGDPAPTTLAGEVWDRISGQGLRDALVHAVGPDSLVHVARADERGIFALRYLPAGDLVLTGFDDVDRDGEADAREVKGYLAVTIAEGDTLIVDVPVLAPDTTAAVLGRATALDSVTVVLEFDDYLDPASDVSAVQVGLAREGGAAPAVSRLYHEHEYAAYVQRVTDSLTALAGPPQSPVGTPIDTLTVDVTGDTVALPAPPGPEPPDAPPDTAAVGAPGRPGAQGVAPAPRGPTPLPPRRARGPAGAPGRLLPGQRIVALLAGPLAIGLEHQVRAAAVVNINGLDGGGGEVALLLAPPPAAPADTTVVPADTTAAPPDTIGGGGR